MRCHFQILNDKVALLEIVLNAKDVFSERAMEHLKAGGIVIYLKISCEEMVRRLE
jgi:hypothetical protein